jgi:hypothetical protein
MSSSNDNLPPLDPLLVEFVKALARDHARRDNRAAARLRGDHDEEGKIEGGSLRAILEGPEPLVRRSRRRA